VNLKSIASQVRWRFITVLTSVALIILVFMLSLFMRYYQMNRQGPRGFYDSLLQHGGDTIAFVCVAVSWISVVVIIGTSGGGEGGRRNRYLDGVLLSLIVMGSVLAWAAWFSISTA